MQSGRQRQTTVELDRAFFYAPRPLIDRAPGNDVTSLTTYTTHTRVGDTRIYIVRTRGKAIIGMALRAIKRNVKNNYMIIGRIHEWLVVIPN